MQRAVTGVLVASFAVLGSAARAGEIAAPSKLDAVTVFPSGAEVTRIAKVKVERGEHTLLINDLPREAQPGSIRVEGKATGRLDIGSVDTRRLSVPRSDAAQAATERKRIEDEIEKLKDQRTGLQGLIQAAEAQKTLITNLASLPTRPPVPLAPGQTARGEDWPQIIGLIGVSMGDVHKTILDTQIKIRDLDRKIDELTKKLGSVAPMQEERTEVKVFVNAAAPLEADITVLYQVGNSAWTPFYDARLTTGTKTVTPKLALTRRASITQRTGEAWENVTMALSTTRPSAGTSAPELNTWTVDFEPERKEPPRPAPMAGAPASIAMQDKLAEAAPMRKLRSAAAEPVPQAATEVQAAAETATFQTVFSVPGRLSVPNTGEAKRVFLDEAQLDPALTVRTVPRRDAKAFLYAKLVLPKGSPYLPGQVSVFRDATFVGNGRLPLLAPGDEHELGFGVDDSVRVRYSVAEDKRGETGLISSSRTDQKNYRISVKNLHERAVQLVVHDHIPVSQNQDIKVELIGKTPPTKRDVDEKRGVMSWDGRLDPDEEKMIEFGYRITWPGTKSIQYGGGR